MFLNPGVTGGRKPPPLGPCFAERFGSLALLTGCLDECLISAPPDHSCGSVIRLVARESGSGRIQGALSIKRTFTFRRNADLLCGAGPHFTLLADLYVRDSVGLFCVIETPIYIR